MPQDLTPTLTLGFYGLIAWCLSASFAGFRILAGENVTRGIALRVGVLVWLGAPAVLAFQGALLDFNSSPPNLLKLVGAMMVLLVGLVISPLGKRAAELLPESLLVGAQVFRFPLEILLYSLSARQLLPQETTVRGYNFDIVTGALALPLWWMLRCQKAPRFALGVWNVLGSFSLLTALGLVVVSLPEPWGYFEPANFLVGFFPWVWLPTFLLTFAFVSHLLVFRKLLLPPRARGENI